MKVDTVAAAAENGVTDRDGELPRPSLPADTRQYREQTADWLVILGRRTCESLPEDFPGSTQVVLSRSKAKYGVQPAQNVRSRRRGRRRRVTRGRPGARRRRAATYEPFQPDVDRTVWSRVPGENAGDASVPGWDRDNLARVDQISYKEFTFEERIREGTRGTLAPMDQSILPHDIAEYLSSNRSELVEFAETLVGYETQNPPGRTAAAVDWLESRLDGTDINVERIEVDPEKPNLVATLEGKTDRTLCFNGHLDTVRFDASEWSRSPLGERVDDRIYGRGATDMKGAVAAMLQVVLAHARTGTDPPVGLQFAFVSDEETGGDAGLTTVLETSDFDPDACVVGETTSRKGRFSVSVADRGYIWVTIEASGTAAHGSRPMIGDNAIDRLYDAIDQLRTEFGQQELTVDPAMDDIIDESVGFYEPEAGAEATRRLYQFPTINLGILKGGTAINSVPASACARVDIRLTAGVDTGEALTSIRTCFDGMEGIEITGLSWTRGSYEPLDSPIVEASADAAERVVDDPVYRRSATGGGDAKVLRHNDIPTVEFGFGTQTAHGTDEYTTVEALVRNATAYAIIPYTYYLHISDISG